ncbi:stress-inducible protein [Streptomyces camponoticapitis]|uniref:Stress-inducible protein n=1 Tax=Streptomyces camponoticapitis TaxID=1616125 RepID=A0ABQ2ETW7_9ACTN|nr:universal stress protein [Streptomyces camponoticapitis]GGK22150.1 stress-inducible protein [Streptomyces camponoticapitis]
MLRPVLVGVDGSPESLAAAEWAAAEASLSGHPLRLVRAWEEVSYPSGSVPDVAGGRHGAGRALRAAEGHLTRKFPGTRPTCELVQGPAVPTLLAAAAEAETLVLGSRGLSGAAGYLAGSVASDVVAHAARPVVLVRSAAHRNTAADAAPVTASPDRVVLGIDLAHHCEKVIEFAFDAAGRRGASLYVLHSYDLPMAYAIASAQMPEYQDLLAEERTDALTAVLRPWQEKYPTVHVTADAVMDRAADRLVKAASGAALLVIGRQERRSRLGAHLGHVAHSVIHHAVCPVAVVPHG